MNKRKIMTLALTLCMVAILAIGGTLAYFTDTTNEIQNTFTMGKVDIELDEAPVGEDGKEIEGGNRVESNDYTKTNMVPGYEYDKDPTIHVLKGSEESYIFLDMTINKYSSLFWVMAADAAEDTDINLPLYKDGALADEFKNDKGVFSTTKFIAYMMANKDKAQAIVNKWFNDIEHEKWTVKEIIKNDDYLTLRLAYKDTVNAKAITEDSIDIQFMSGFQMPASVTQKMIEDGKTIGKMQNAFNTEKKAFVMNFKAYAIQASTLDADEAYAEVF